MIVGGRGAVASAATAVVVGLLTNLATALRHAADHGFAGVRLVPGTEPFVPNPAGLVQE